MYMNQVYELSRMISIRIFSHLNHILHVCKIRHKNSEFLRDSEFRSKNDYEKIPGKLSTGFHKIALK